MGSLKSEVQKVFGTTIEGLTEHDYSKLIEEVSDLITNGRQNGKVFFTRVLNNVYHEYTDLYKAQIFVEFDDYNNVITVLELANGLILIIVELGVKECSDNYKVSTYLIDDGSGEYKLLLDGVRIGDYFSSSIYTLNNYIFDEGWNVVHSVYDVVSKCIKSIVESVTGYRVNDYTIEEFIESGLFEHMFQELTYVGTLYCSDDSLLINGSTPGEPYFTLTFIIPIPNSVFLLFLNIKHDNCTSYVYVSMFDYENGKRLLGVSTR